MNKSVSTAILVLLFSLVIPTLGMAKSTELPILSVVGNAHDYEVRVNVSIRLEADKYAPAYCFSEVDLSDRTIKYPHTFYISGVTLSDIKMDFGLDFDVHERLRQKIFKAYPLGIGHDGSLISSGDYFLNCAFQLNEVTVSTQQTTLVVRDSFYNRLENTFRVPYGTTRTADYSLNRARKRIRFEVFFTKNGK